MKKLLLLLIVLFPLNIMAKEDNFVNIKCDQQKININEQVVCRISANSDVVFNKINYTLELTDGLKIVDVRSNYVDLWSIKDNSFMANELVDGLQEFGILLLKSDKSGVMKVEFKNIVLENTNTGEKINLKDSFADLKVISDDNLLTGININDEPLENFKNNILTYNYYIDNETNKIKISADKSNEFSEIVGIGEFELSTKEQKFVFPIQVKSENGNSKIYIVNVIRKDFNSNNINKELETIKVTDNNKSILLINFKPDKYEYNISVGMNTKSLNISPELNNDSLSFVKKYGERTIELNNGDNIVLIKVKDEFGEVLTYTLNFVKPLINKSDNNYIKDLKIKNYKLEFNKKIKKYTLEIDADDKVLSIEPILDDNKATYEITGNKNLKEGSIIKIVVTAENQVKLTYQIHIKIKETNYLSILIWVIIILMIGGLCSWVYFKYKMVLKLKKLEVENKKKLANSSKNVQKNNKKKSVKTKSKNVVNNSAKNINKKQNDKKVFEKSNTKNNNKVKKNVSSKSKTTTKKNVKKTNSKSNNKKVTSKKVARSKNAKKK